MRLKNLCRIILLLLFLSTAINYIDRQTLAVLFPTLRLHLGLTSAQYGGISTGFFVAYTLSQLFFGLVIDRWGTKNGFICSIVIWSGAAIAQAYAHGARSLGLCRFLMGLGEGGNWPAGGKAVAEWYPPHHRAFAMGVFDAGSAVGAIIAPPLVAVLTVRCGWRAAFIGTGGLGAVWLAAWLLIYSPPASHQWLAAAVRACMASTSPPVDREAFFAPLRSIIGIRPLWGLLVTRMLATPVWWFYVFWLPDYLAKDRGFTLAEIGRFGWIPFLTADLGKLIGGLGSDRLLARGWQTGPARKTLMFLGAAAMIAGVRVAGAQTSAGALGWVCLATAGFGIWGANIFALHADYFSSDRMGTALGFTGTGASLGGALATYAIGLSVAKWGYPPVFWAAGGSILLASGVLWLGVNGLTLPRTAPSS